MIFALIALARCKSKEQAPEKPIPKEAAATNSDADVLRVLAHVEIDRIFDTAQQTGDLPGAVGQMASVLSNYREQLKETVQKGGRDQANPKKPRVSSTEQKAEANYFYDEY